MEMSATKRAKPTEASLKGETEEAGRDPIVMDILVQAKLRNRNVGNPLAEELREVELLREWLEGRMHYIDHAIENRSGIRGRCRQCGEALGTGQLTNAPGGALCLICQRNLGQNAKFRTP